MDDESRVKSTTLTTRTLLLMRHADAEYGVMADFQRPLSLRGRQQAFAAGHVLLSKYGPSLVLCSTAVRAQSTLDLVFKEKNAKTDVISTPALYEASASTMLEVIRDAGTSWTVEPSCLLVIAHEPTLSILADQLAGPDSDPGATHMVRVGVMTAGVIALEFSSSWQELSPGSTTLTRIMPPPARG